MLYVSRLYYLLTSNGRGCTTDDVARSGKMFLQELFFFFFFGFPAPDRVPTELEELLLHWKTDDAKERQGLLLQSLNVTVPNNPKQQLALDTVMESIDHMVEAGQDKMTCHVCHIGAFPELNLCLWTQTLILCLCK